MNETMHLAVKNLLLLKCISVQSGDFAAQILDGVVCSLQENIKRIKKQFFNGIGMILHTF